MADNNYWTNQKLDHRLPLLSRTARRARTCEVRTIHTPAALEDEERWRPLVLAGAEVRVLDSIPMKLLVRDGEEAMVSLRNPLTGRQSPISIIMRHPDLIAPLKAMFEQAWESGVRIEA